MIILSGVLLILGFLVIVYTVVSKRSHLVKANLAFLGTALAVASFAVAVFTHH